MKKNNVEMDNRRKKQEKMTNREWFWKRALGGGENEQNISRIAGNPLSVSAIIAPLLKKNPELQGKRRLLS